MTDIIAADDPRMQFYGRWQVGATAVTVTNGAECELAFTGASCVLCFDVSAPGIVYPILACWVDGVGPVRVPLDASGCVEIRPAYHDRPKGDQPFATVCASRHHVRFQANIESGYPVRNENWTTLRDAVKFTGVELGEGETLLPVPRSPRTIEFLGDSITAGLGILYTATDGRRMADASPEINWPEYAARLLGLRALVNGHGGQGITSPSTDGAPVAEAAFPYVFDGVPWQPAVPSEAVVIYHGTNDGEFSAGQYASYLRTIRAAYPAAWLFAIVPHYKTGHVAPIREAVAELADARIRFLDYTAAFSDADTNDYCHFNPGGAVHMGLRVASDVAAVMSQPKQA